MAETNLGKVMLTPKGTYSASSTYNILDIVLSGGASFVVLKNNVTGVTPTDDGVNYHLLAAAADEITIESIVYQYAAQNAADFTGEPPATGWSSEPPVPSSGNYLWTRTITTYSEGTEFTAYMVARNGTNGTGAVSTVNGVNPDGTGNVVLSIGNIATVDASPTSGSGNLVTSGGVNQFVYSLVSQRLATNQGSGNAGKFLVVGDDGNVTLRNMDTWTGGSY